MPRLFPVIQYPYTWAFPQYIRQMPYLGGVTLITWRSQDGSLICPRWSDAHLLWATRELFSTPSLFRHTEPKYWQIPETWLCLFLYSYEWPLKNSIWDYVSETNFNQRAPSWDFSRPSRISTSTWFHDNNILVIISRSRSSDAFRWRGVPYRK